MESKLNQLPKSPTKEDVLTLLASATNLNWLANYIERNKGQSFKTATLWQESKGSLKKVVNELKSVARFYDYSGLMNLLKN